MDHHNIQLRSIPLTVTTRGIGIAVVNIDQESVDQFHYKEFPTDSSSDDEYFRKRSDRHPSINALYRACLGLLESKLSLVSAPFTTAYKDEDINNNLRQYFDIRWTSKVPTPVARIIDAIGVVRYKDRVYHPVVAAPVYYQKYKLIPRSENVLLSTLQQTVEALADPKTSPNDRIRFKETCPIPGAIWNDNDTLSNPNDIIPIDYYTNIQLQNEDLHKLYSCSQLYCRNTYLSGKLLDNSLGGKISLLMSCKLIGVRMNPHNHKKTTYSYEGFYNNYDISSPEPLSTRDQLEGLHNLLGEVPTSDQHVIYYPRHKINHSYIGNISRSIKYLHQFIEDCKDLKEDMLLSSIPLTVTSRGIGFTVAELVREIYRRNRDTGRNYIYKLYRVCLWLFECRLRNIWPVTFRTTDTDYYTEKKEEYAFPRIFRDEFSIFLPKSIMNLINAIGLIQCKGRDYHPVAAAPVYYENGKLMPRSENVLLSTLRQTVEALADRDTLPRDRTRFKDTCPIPGAIWNDENILMNPDEIIPQGYTSSDDFFSNFHQDMTDIRRFLNQCDQPMVNSSLNKERKTKGMSILLSNVLQEMRVSPRHRDETLDVYSNRCRVEGDMSGCFTSPFAVNTTEQVYGLLHLLGEVPTDYRTHYKYIYVPREQISHSYEVHRHTCYKNLYAHNMKRLELEMRNDNNETVPVVEANCRRQARGGRRRGRGRGHRNQHH